MDPSCSGFPRGERNGPDSTNGLTVDVENLYFCEHPYLPRKTPPQTGCEVQSAVQSIHLRIVWHIDGGRRKSLVRGTACHNTEPESFSKQPARTRVRRIRHSDQKLDLVADCGPEAAIIRCPMACTEGRVRVWKLPATDSIPAPPVIP